MLSRIFNLIFFLLLSTSTSGQCHEGLTKQQQWDNSATEVDTWVDGLGRSLDEGIKETVIVLNLLGFTTRQSCEGHLNWGVANPWIDFTLNRPEVVALDNQRSEFFEAELKEQLLALRIKYPDLSMDETFHTPEGELLKRPYSKFLYLFSLYNEEAKKDLMPLFDLLDEFYKIHASSGDQKLCIEISGSIRLESFGGYLQDQRPGHEREANLGLYREEMEAFTSFLKDRFFSTIES